MHQQYTGQIIILFIYVVEDERVTPVVLKMDIPVCFTQNKIENDVFLPTMISIMSCIQICAPIHVQVQLSVGVLN